MSLREHLKKYIYKFFRLLPLRRHKVLLFSYYGEQYSGSPKYIGNHLKSDTSLEIVWAFTKPAAHSEVKGKKVRYGRLGFLYHLATAGFVITNYRMTSDFEKRTGQVYIQTWHSSLRLKMIEKDAVDTLPAHYTEMAKRDSRQIDYLLAGSGKSKEIFERAFWYDGKIVETGTPQCDILFGDNSLVKEKVFAHFKIPQNAHIALYAPTFRKNHDTSVYNLDTEQLLRALSKRFGGEWYLLMRLHPHLVNLTGCFSYSEHVLPATTYDDVQELLAVTEALITDYSAIMFDYAVTRRPCFLYTPDLQDYTQNDRSLYFDLRELPFNVCYTNEELCAQIDCFSDGVYAERIASFLLEVDSYDDGAACSRVAQLIEENLK